MKLLIISKFGQAKIVSSDVLPSVGERVCLFYEPFPTVTTVVHWPSIDLLAKAGITENGIDALLTVE